MPDVACAFDGFAEPLEATVSASAAQSAICESPHSLLDGAFDGAPAL
jgi:hypothetical protein